VSDGGPDPRNQPLGRGVTVTDWRPYTADHRHIDGGGNHNARSSQKSLNSVRLNAVWRVVWMIET
jgi:hypothetical protein